MTADRGEDPSYTWRLKGDVEEFAPMAISDLVANAGRTSFPELADLFPFRHAFRAESFLGDGWWAVRMVDAPTGAIPALGQFESSALMELQARMTPFAQRSHADLCQHQLKLRTFTD
jgi:hypothetical protein